MVTKQFDDIYQVNGNNWYQVPMYSFEFKSTKWPTPVEMPLPINPSELSVTTQFATNITTTMTSVVEEHSNVKIYEISIRGTTGIAPKYVEPFNTTAVTVSEGRKSYIYKPIIPNIGFFQKTISAINTVAEQAQSLKNNSIESGVYTDNNGYIAFHNLYRFFLYYKNEIAPNKVPASSKAIQSLTSIIPTTPLSSQTPMVFKNRKDGVAYDVSPKSFLLTRSESSPMLYNYSIALIGYNLRSIDELSVEESTDERLASLGLGDNSSLVSKFMGYVKGATSIVKTLKGGIRGFGS